MSHRRICYCCENGDCTGICLRVDFPGTRTIGGDLVIRRCECERSVKLVCIDVWKWRGLDPYDHQVVVFEVTKEDGHYLARLTVEDEDGPWGEGAGTATWTADLGEHAPDPENMDCTVAIEEDGGLGCVPADEVHVSTIPAGESCYSDWWEDCNRVCDCETAAEQLMGPRIVAVTVTDYGGTLPGYEGISDECSAVNRSVVIAADGLCNRFGFSETTQFDGGEKSLSISAAVTYSTVTAKTTISVSVVRCIRDYLGWVSCPVYDQLSKTLDGRINCKSGPVYEMDTMDLSRGYCLPGKATFQVLG